VVRFAHDNTAFGAASKTAASLPKASYWQIFDRTEEDRMRYARRIAVVVAALAAAGSMSACFHVPARVWYNGQAMESSWQYGAFLYGEHTPQTMRGMYYNSNALRIAAPGHRFTPFGNW
jgi:hypothetical protein